ncbi:MAG: ROK family protein, partial [candidate division Zixibacteria bacterium]|nr:ROK family protein [candidate division Zixibacteria bacterium]NIS48281.1 ROK family protein [candidate division Zixibacteria bacterium]NIU16399.1 ROK family protein [candidate division Zixibacteria bacterium]NIV08518.1 ROK family protein [candidate division Zixibacteria bacterium]NIW48232.1 ROK family protein [Gammaproteobacteria bacterium]
SGNIISETRFPTTTPGETLDQAISFFRNLDVSLSGIGIACFGPVDLNKNSRTYGYITSTPKPGWENTDVVGRFKDVFGIPVGFDTDVNGAALGEGRWGAARELNTHLYITIGTGIGGGFVANGNILHGLVHPEMGHILLPHDRERDPYEGFCPFHQDCFEGLAAGPAIEGRWGEKAESLPVNHPAWELEAEYIAAALHIFLCTLSPQKVILGGGVMKQHHILPIVHRQLLESLNGYIQHPVVTGEIS